MFKKNLTKRNIANKIYQNLGFSKNYSLSFVNNFFETFASELVRINKIKISSFGTFQVVNKK